MVENGIFFNIFSVNAIPNPVKMQMKKGSPA